MQNRISHIPQEYVRKQTDQGKLKMNSQKSVEAYTSQLRERFVKSFLDILILRLIENKPTWGYNIIRETNVQYNINLRHGALYPTLNELEEKGLLKSTKKLQKGRIRRIYSITPMGKQVLQASQEFLRQQTIR
jgi:PadR family transcriptional regulator PadR